jgi:putative IMPACT (imprinted ancient) family translation regulator
LGYAGDIYRVSDDGEPSGTAGKPIYGQLLSNDLTGVLAVVVRYFGGILLGTGGLVHAYRSATADMLSRAVIVTRFAEEKIQVVFPYDAIHTVMKMVREEQGVVLKQDFSTRCILHVSVRKSRAGPLMQRLAAIQGLTCELLQISD